MVNNLNNKTIDEILDIMMNDSENPKRLLPYLADDCVWTIEPGGSTYKGSMQIQKFIEVALAHKPKNKNIPKGITLTNKFSDNENLCIEYSHLFMLGHTFSFFNKMNVRHCNTYHIENGKIKSIHEYAGISSWWFGLVMQAALRYIHWETKKNGFLPKS